MKEIKAIKKIKPMFDRILVTADTYNLESQKTDTGIYVPSQTGLRSYQTVIAVGTSVRNVKEGDIVEIDPKRYARMKHQEGSLKDGVITDNPVVAYNFDIINLNGKDYLMLFESDVKFIIEDCDFAGDNPILVKNMNL